jgi:hypothetical protein
LADGSFWTASGHRANSMRHSRAISSTGTEFSKIQRELMPLFRVLQSSQGSSRYPYNFSRLF